ncbi:MAG: hypothetical protein M3P49_07300 [Actinomycetota bacterium]|nr:hypothetical protein [Actinomycetota bacterium]
MITAGTAARTTGVAGDDALLVAAVRRAIALSREGSRLEAESVMAAACELAEDAAERRTR